MRLKIITELNLLKAAEKVRPLLSTMSKSKIKHSKRVAKSLSKAGAGKISVYAGLLHDYLERGGDVYALSQHIDEIGLPREIVDVVRALSNDEKDVNIDSYNKPLEHLKSVLNSVEDEELRNIIILAKLSDRLDNLIKRSKRGKIGRRYRDRSFELIEWLQDNYTGKKKPIKRLLNAISEILPAVVFTPIE
jgi:(p)ppGpp synthase/HD superfamily hydrolase